MLSRSKKQYSIISILLFFSSVCFSQSTTLNEKCKQSGFACGECETSLQQDFNKLLDSILETPVGSERWSTANKKMTTKPGLNAEDFIKQALDLMKKKNTEGNNRLNMIVIGNSESLHETTPGNPRVAIKSPDGEFWLTFNTDPKASGYNNVEIMRWDGKSGSFKFQEIEFSSDKTKKGHVDFSGEKCMKCHREPMRPNWDTYRSWSNVLPPRDDLIESDSNGKADIAGRSYLSFLRKIAESKKNPTGANKRLSLLEIPGENQLSDNKKIEFMMESVKEKSFYRVPHYPPKEKLKNYSEKTAPLAGSSHLGFDQLSGQNICRISANIQANPNFNKFKYALAGFVKCSGSNHTEVDWNETKKYFPESFQKQVYNYFKSSQSLNHDNKKIVPGSSDQVLPSLFQHVKSSHASVDKAKDERAYKMLKDQSSLSDVSGSDNEIKSFLNKVTQVDYPYTAIEDPGGVQSVKESDPGLIANLRYLLEPFGVKVNSWSMVSGRSVADATYSFSDQFADMLEEQEFINQIYDSTPGNSNTEKCENLQSESKKRLDGSISFNSQRSANDYLGKACEEFKESELVAQKIRSDLGDKTCLVCHSSVYTHIGEAFTKDPKKALLQKTSLGMTLGEHVKNQLNTGRMPPGGWSIGRNENERLKNDKDRREALIRYVDFVSGQTTSMCTPLENDKKKPSDKKKAGMQK